MQNSDFFADYLRYIGVTESPTIFHRWCALSGVAAMLGYNKLLPFGHSTIAPNMYVMLLGRAGVRKSTAIKTFKSLIIQAGYTTIAADRTTKEKFLLDLAGEDEVAGGAYKKSTPEAILESNLWGDSEDNLDPTECFIVADEWNEFTSLGNVEFYGQLGNMWDYRGVYKNRIKTGKSVSINQPVLNILAANTPTGFAQAFPQEIIGQGFFSRLLLIHGEETGRRITFPHCPSPEDTAEIVARLAAIRRLATPTSESSPLATKLLDKIYQSYKGFEDARFESYMNRRMTHLLKLCITVSAANFNKQITESDVVYANTILHYAEIGMPKALGEFGKGKNSDVANKVIDILSNTKSPMPMLKLWSLVSHDCDKQSSLLEILTNLRAADKIQTVGNGFMAKRKVVEAVSTEVVDASLLTAEETGV